MVAAEILFDILSDNPEGLGTMELQDALGDHNTFTPVNLVMNTLRAMLPENVVIHNGDVYRFARTFGEGRDWLFRKLTTIKRMSDNVDRDVAKLAAHFPEADIASHLDIALGATRTASKAISVALSLT